MAVLSTIFKAVDQMSVTFTRMGEAGEVAIERWERSASAADDALGRAADGAAQAAEATTSAASSATQWTDAVSEYARATTEAIASTEELVQAGAQTEGSLGSAADAAEQATTALEDLGEESERAGDSSEDFGERAVGGIQSLESALAAAGIVVGLTQIADVFFVCSEAAAAYEVELAKVSTIADTSVMSMRGISTQLTTLSMETGEAVEGLADASYQAISAGVDTANAVEFAGDAAKLAAGGFTDATTAVDVLTTALNAYGLETSQATKISDMLVTTQNLGKTTVNELATNVGKVIPLAAAYGVEMDNLSAGYAIMTANGIATAESTTYIKAMLSELGTSSSVVATTLKDETGQSFAELTANGYSLGDVLAVLGDSVHGNATAFNELWGSTEAGVGALSLFNSGAEKYNTVLGQMQDSAGATAAAYEIMSDTTSDAQEGMRNSANNLAIAYGTAVNPAVKMAYNLIADLVDGMTRFVSEHPAVVAAITAAVAVVGIAVLGIVALSTVTTVATAAVGVFGTTVAAVFWPITAIVAGIAALAAGIAVVVNMVGSANEEFDSLTATSKAQSEELDALNAEYEEAVQLYGENSEQAQALSREIAGLEAEYETCSSTIETFVAKNDALIESHDELVASYESGSADLEKETRNTAALVGRLDELAAKSSLSAGEQAQMSAIVEKLNTQVPELALTYDALTGEMNKSVDAIHAMAEEQAKQQSQEANYDAYVKLFQDKCDLAKQLEKATSEAAAAQERFNEASGWDKFWNVGKVTSDLEDFTEEQERVQTALDETNGLISDQEEAFEAAEAATEAAAAVAVDYETGVSNAITSVAGDVDKLAAEWDKSYAAARENIDNTIGLFDTMKTATELSISDMTSAMESQVEYLTTYSENLRKAAEYGLDGDLIASLSDGSTESAGQLDAIIGKIETLGGTTADAAGFIKNFNDQFSAVSAAKDTFVATSESMKMGFDAAMTDIEDRMMTAISEMNMSKDAATAAEATVGAYISAIKGKVEDAKSAAAAVAAAAKSALLGTQENPTAGYASGTDNATPGWHMVGEEGPELMHFAGGERVLPADATAQILGASSRPAMQTNVPEGMERAKSEGAYSERKITIELAGCGSIELTGGKRNTDEAVAWLDENLRPAIVGVLRKEMQEEGDGAYEF